MIKPKAEAVGHRNARSEARDNMLYGPGDLYAARTADGLWMKIGFSTQVHDRIRNLNAEYKGHAVFSLVATTRSTFRVEQKLHRAMHPLHQVPIRWGREIYPVMPAVLGIVSGLIEKPDELELDLDTYLSLLKWCRAAAKEDANRLPALHGHREIVAQIEQARARYHERLWARIQAREAARASA